MHQHARALVAGLIHEGLDVNRLNGNARAELRKALDVVLDLAESNAGMRESLIKCQTLTPSLLTGEQAIERLKEINVFVYRCLGMAR